MVTATSLILVVTSSDSLGFDIFKRCSNFQFPNLNFQKNLNVLIFQTYDDIGCCTDNGSYPEYPAQTYSPFLRKEIDEQTTYRVQ